MEFEWDDTKDESNFKKHGIRFSEAASVWLDEAALEIHDSEHGRDEERWVRIGISRVTRILVVVFVEKIEGLRMRIISARKATRKETEQYISRSK